MSNAKFAEPTQNIVASSYFQKKFEFTDTDGTATEPVRSCRYLNQILKIFGDDVVIDGGGPQSVSLNSNNFSVQIGDGKIIQDSTLIKFPTFTLTFSDTNLLPASTSIIGVAEEFTFTEGSTTVEYDISVESEISVGDWIYAYDGVDGVSDARRIISIDTNANEITLNSAYDGSTSGWGTKNENAIVYTLSRHKAIVFTKFKFKSVSRDVDTDPNPLTFRLGIYDTVEDKVYQTAPSTEYPWDSDVNRVIISIIDLDNVTIADQDDSITIKGTTYTRLGDLNSLVLPFDYDGGVI